ncbi:MAG: hypothetical protein H6700_06550 [Myxococcales bacterium]|nr:hypothetical protein [Myxococcales bacterium]
MTEPGSLRRAVRAALILARPHALAAGRAAPSPAASDGPLGSRRAAPSTVAPTEAASAEPPESTAQPTRRSLVPRGIARSETGTNHVVPPATGAGDAAPSAASHPASPTHDSSTRPLPLWDATADALSRSAILAEAARGLRAPVSEPAKSPPPPAGARTVASPAVGHGGATQALEPIDDLDETPTGRSSALREPLEEAGGDWAPIDSLPKPGDRGPAGTAAMPASRGTMQLGALDPAGATPLRPARDGATGASDAASAPTERAPAAESAVDAPDEPEER